MAKKRPITWHLYKDTFLSGWGLAKRGSYVISDMPLQRREFKLLGTGTLDEFIFGSGKGRHFELWLGVQAPIGKPKAIRELQFVRRGKPLKVGKRKW